MLTVHPFSREQAPEERLPCRVRMSPCYAQKGRRSVTRMPASIRMSSYRRIILKNPRVVKQSAKVVEGFCLIDVISESGRVGKSRRVPGHVLPHLPHGHVFALFFGHHPGVPLDHRWQKAAREAGVPICGWCPPGGLAEDMPEPPGLLAAYPELKEGPSEGYVERTALNVRDSHATLIVAPAGIEPRSGTEMTVMFAERFGRPVKIIRGMDDIAETRAWIEGLGLGITLNVAGPRESKTPGTYATTKNVVSVLLALP